MPFSFPADVSVCFYFCLIISTAADGVDR